MKDLIVDIANATKANALLLFIFATVMAALPLVMSSLASSSGTSWVVSTIVIYQLHRQILTGFPMTLSGKLTPPEWTELPKESTLRFILVSGLFTLLFGLPAGLVAFSWAENFDGDEAKRQFTGIMFLSGFVLCWLLLSVFGTAFPAASIGQPFSPRRIWQAGRKTALRVAGQLVVFPGFTHMALLILTYAIGQFFSDKLEVQPVAFVVEVIFGTLFMLPSLMTVVTLVRAYRAAYPQM